jgi:Zn-finger nucleic acid-binding protein
MKCPIDGNDLTMTDRSGIEIDYCPKCRGVWLDRGELDKIIERSAQLTAQPAAPPQPQASQGWDRGRDRDRDYDDRRHYDDRKHYRKKRGGFLGDLFDFD